MESSILQIAREGLYLVLVVSAPPLVASLGIGLFISVVQATTQIQEQTLTFVPKLVGVMLTLALTAPWIGAQLLRFTRMVLLGIAGV